MNRNDHDEREDALIGLLADYDEALANGRSTSSLAHAFSAFDLRPEWENIRTCLELLHRVRPSGLEVGRSTTARAAGGPTRLGRFVVEGELGRGGVGIVYLAHDPKLNRQVALKVPRFEFSLDNEARKRFLVEAEAAARVSHPNLVTLLDVGEDGPTLYLASEFCPGPTLTEWIAQQGGRTSFRQSAAIVKQLAHAVEHAHSRGVLHRDIKPSNVLMVDDPLETGDSARLKPKLTDFGMAKLLERTSRDRTHTGTILGTLAYMAPEQLNGHAQEVDARTDIYSLGAILYELLTGVAPYTGDSDLAILKQLIANEATLPRKLRHDIPRDLEAITLKCLASSREARYASTGALADDLGRFLEHLPTVARPLRISGRMLNWVKRRPTVATLWLVTLLGAVSVAGVSALHIRNAAMAAKESDQLRTVARNQRVRAAKKQSTARRVLYASRMRAAQQASREGNLALLRAILQEYAGSTNNDLRHFEWNHLNYLAHMPHQVFAGHSGDAYAVTYSPDGQYVLTGGQDGTVRIWNVATGASLAILQEHSECVNTIDFSPDGDTFATASCDKTIKLWSLRDRRLLKTLEGHTTAIDSCTFIDDGKLLLSFSREAPRNELLIWDAASGNFTRDSPPARVTVEGIAIAPSRRTLMTFADGGIETWTVKDKVWKRRIHCPGISPRLVSGLSPDEDIALMPTTPHYLTLLRLGDGEVINELSNHSSGVDAVAFQFDGKRFATASRDGSICIFRFPSCKLEHRLLGHAGGVWRVAWSPSGDSIASVGHDGTLRIWSLTGGTSRLQLQNDERGQGLIDIAYLRDGRHINAAYPDYTLVWNLETGRRASLESIDSPRLKVDQLRLDDAPINGASHPLLPQWNPRASVALLRFIFDDFGPADGTESAARLLSDGSKVVEVRDGRLRTWSVNRNELIDDQPILHFNPPSIIFDISLSGRVLCGTSEDGHFQIRDVKQWKSTDLGALGPVGAARISPLEDRILVLSGHVDEFDLRTGAHLREYVHERGTVIAYSADAQRIAIASDLGYIAIHDAATGEHLLQLESGPVGRLLFAEDGSSLATDGGPQGGVFLWPGKKAAN